MPRGLFVTFEGIEGTGKSTQVALAAERLSRRGMATLVTREPGGTPLGESLRALLLARREAGSDPLVETLLMVADRAEHVRAVIRPGLAQGKVVLCDRHADATVAYQGGGSGVDLQKIAEWNRLATGGLVPDLTVLLDLPPAHAVERLEARAKALDRFESEPVSFFERVRRTYLDLAAASPQRWLVLAAESPSEELAERIEAEILRRLPRQAPTGVGFPKT
ncbi:MAG TPA: dTMP kinase [Candidatus Eisenbacteria bacterium]|nr:dTMP kinase [Candidatus Eisenbacteria bacterium]